MNPPSRVKQTGVILLAILIVLLVLWRLRTRPQDFGGVGSWASTNILGPATLNILSGVGEGSDIPPQVGTNMEPSPLPVGPAAPHSNTPPGTPSLPSTNRTPPASHPPLSTNLLNTNGPVTVIAVAPGDLVETPPGVTAASNVAEASSIEQRLGAASAKGGDIQISLSWNNYNDLDLHCIDPTGEEIWFSHPISSRTHGELDVDQNAHPPYTKTPVENIYWPIGGAPSGLYRIFVVYYAPRNGMDPAAATAFTVRTVVKDWKTYYFRSTINFTGHQEPKTICTLQYDPGNADPSRRFRFVQ